MANSFSVIGAPKQVAVSTSAALLAAIPTAKPGTVLTLDTVVAPFELTINSERSAPGICIVLPAAQVVKTTISVPNANVEILRGRHSADEFSGGYKSGYGVSLNGAGKVALRFGWLASSSHLVACATSCSDIIMEDMAAEYAVADVSQWQGAARVQFNRVKSLNTRLRGKQILWWTTGTAPSDGVSDTSNGTTSFWRDAEHSDFFQISGAASSDITVTDCECHTDGQGIVGFATNAFTRARIEGNDIRGTHVYAYHIRGDEVLLRGNTVGVHPADPAIGTPTMLFDRYPDAAQQVRAGGNVALAGASLTAPTTGSAVSLGGADNGDAVTAPSLPDLPRLPWAPTYSRPAVSTRTAAPEITGPPWLYFTNASEAAAFNTGAGYTAPGVGAWITVGLGECRGSGPLTYEFRWTRGGAPISGATGRVYQLTGSDTGQVIGCEVRVTDNNGTSAWRASATFTGGA